MAVKDKEKLVVYLDIEDAQWLRSIATDGERSVTGLVRLAVKAYRKALEPAATK